MALKLEHKCTRCNRATSTEVSNVAAATASEELEGKRAEALERIQQFLASIAPEHMPDLFVVRRGEAPVMQTYLCDDEDAKRSCVDRVNFIIEECKTFDPRKPKTRKPKVDATAEPLAAEPLAAEPLATEKKNDKKPNAAAAKQ